MADNTNDPQVKFNLNKLNQFRYNTEHCNVDVSNLEKLEEFF